MIGSKILDLKGGKEIFYNSLDSISLNKPIDLQLLSEDLMCIEYDNCIIDVGCYKDGPITIEVIPKTDGKHAWGNAYCIIKCFDVLDLYNQIQRAIDIYPNITMIC